MRKFVLGYVLAVCLAPAFAATATAQDDDACTFKQCPGDGLDLTGDWIGIATVFAGPDAIDVDIAAEFTLFSTTPAPRYVGSLSIVGSPTTIDFPVVDATSNAGGHVSVWGTDGAAYEDDGQASDGVHFVLVGADDGTGTIDLSGHLNGFDEPILFYKDDGSVVSFDEPILFIDLEMYTDPTTPWVQ
jgi:hypothetical protein